MGSGSLAKPKISSNAKKDNGQFPTIISLSQEYQVQVYLIAVQSHQFAKVP
jgi:hypothetical protein